MSIDPAALQNSLDAALEKTLLAQSYKVNDGSEVKRPDLGELMAARDQVKQEAAVKNSGGFVRRLCFGRP